ncbi:MAG TPA: transposase [Gammaproteobacteria bacterium]|nr:transposase [Gammaproteobacteria bacterium]
MSDYRRVYIERGMYFFTLVTYQRRPHFANPNNVNLLRDSIRHVRSKRPFDLFAIVILPDHLHCIWQFSDADVDYSIRWQMIKTRFTRMSELPKPVWQPRYWEHAIRDDDDLRRHLDYIHYNPVKHGYAKAPGDWRWSSFSKFVRQGWYVPDWGGVVDVKAILDLNFE